MFLQNILLRVFFLQKRKIRRKKGRFFVCLYWGRKKVLSAFKMIIWVLKNGDLMEKGKIQHVNFLFLKRLCPVSMYSCVLYILLCSLLSGSKPAYVVSVVQGGVLFSKDNDLF